MQLNKSLSAVQWSVWHMVNKKNASNHLIFFKFDWRNDMAREVPVCCHLELCCSAEGLLCLARKTTQTGVHLHWDHLYVWTSSGAFLILGHWVTVAPTILSTDASERWIICFTLRLIWSTLSAACTMLNMQSANRMAAARYIKTCINNFYFPAWVQTGKKMRFWMLHAFHLHNLPVSWWVSHTYPCMEFAGTSLRKRKHWRRMVWRKARSNSPHYNLWWRCKGCDFLWIICWSALLSLQHSFESVIKAHVPCIGQFLPLQGCFWHINLRPSFWTRMMIRHTACF